MAAAMFMNSNSLPIALMQSLVVTVHGLKWGKDDSKDAMLGRALTYLVLYSTLGMILRWSYGVRLLAQADDEVTDNGVPDETTPLLQNGDNRPPHVIVQSVASPTTLRPGHARRRSAFFRSFPNSPNLSRANLSTIDSEPNSSVSTFVSSPLASDSEDDSDLDGDVGLPGTPEIPERSKFSLLLERWRRSFRKAWAVLDDFMTVPLWAALASIIVACVRPFQHVLEEHMVPVKGALTSLGNCSIPVTLVVLGAYFYKPKELSPEEIRAQKRRKRRGRLNTIKSTSALFESVKAMFHPKPEPSAAETKGEAKTVFIAVISRMIITPALLLPFIALSARFDLQNVFADPVFVVSNVLLVSSPPALTLAQITQAASGDAFERLISRTIFWAYCIVTPPATIIYVVIGLLLSKL